MNEIKKKLAELQKSQDAKSISDYHAKIGAPVLDILSDIILFIEEEFKKVKGTTAS